MTGCVDTLAGRWAALIGIHLGANPSGALAASLPTGVSLCERAEVAVPRLVSLLTA
jgi:hypothetical protein